MAIASITTWLNTPQKNYRQGCALYAQYGNKEYLKALFNTGNSSYHFTKLEAALLDLNKLNNPPPKNIIVAEKPKETLLAPIAKFDYGNYPDKIQEIIKAKNFAYAKARKLFETIPFLDSQTHRLEAGKELLADRKFVQECWQAIDKWKESGEIMEVAIKKIETDVADLSLADLIKEQKNIPPNISKDRKKLKECSDAVQKIKFTDRINERTMRLDLINKKLNELI